MPEQALAYRFPKEPQRDEQYYRSENDLDYPPDPFVSRAFHYALHEPDGGARDHGEYRVTYREHQKQQRAEYDLPVVDDYRK